MDSGPLPSHSVEISAVDGDGSGHATPLIVVPVAEGANGSAPFLPPLDNVLGGLIGRALRTGDFKGKEGEAQLLYPSESGGPIDRVLLVGLGKSEKVDAERLRRVGGTAAKQAAKLGLDRVAISTASEALQTLSATEVGRALAEGIQLGSYVFDEMKAKPEPESDAAPRPKLALVELLIEGANERDALAEGIRVGSILGRAENTARRLGNLPGNVATPAHLGDVAQQIALRHGLTATILGPAELEAEGLGALLAVSHGSDEEPRLIVLEHRRGPAGARPLVLVGKGLTFDAGGISIKPAQSMEEMKFDMCGGAAVLGAMQAIAELGLAINVVGIVPSSENLLSGRAMKPGDIIRSHLGKTIEVINTDAEGRLILADALSYARRFDPAAIVDAATLTGSCVIALGHQASAVLGNDEDLIAEIRAAGTRTGERVWPLPMFDEYRDQLKSDYADIKNAGGRPAGAITAAWFLREFVGEIPWAHLDIAGTAYGDGKLSYLTKGATGVPTRLFTEWVLSRTA